uniref:Dynactin subunit 3 n=1 Tax=Loa loa TaxID=7209 RepID=A0A1I7VRU4_LOALO
MHAAEKMHEDGNHLYDELNALIKEGQEVLNDAEAVPTIYTTILDAFMSPLEAAAELLKRMAENEEMAMRLKATKAAEELNDLRNLMSKLQSLSEQLHPLETAYADVRFYDVDVEQTQQQYENLICLMNRELHDENILNESTQQLARN